MFKGECMSNLQNKWIELDQIVQSITGRHTEMAEKKSVSDFLKSLGMKRVMPKIVTERLQDRRTARIYVWLDSPIGNVGLLTGNSISPSLHYLILDKDNVNGDDVDLEVDINRLKYVSVPIPMSMNGIGHVNMPNTRQKPVRRHKTKARQKPVRQTKAHRRNRTTDRIRINPVFVKSEYDGGVLFEKVTYEKMGFRDGEYQYPEVIIEDTFPTVLELSVLNKFFPKIVVADSAKLSANSVVATLSCEYLSKHGYYIQLQYNLVNKSAGSLNNDTDRFDSLDLTASIHNLQDAQLLQRFNFEITYSKNKVSWGQLYTDLFSTFAPFVGEELTKFIENPSAYTIPKVDVIDQSDVIDVSDIPATDEPVEPRIAKMDSELDVPTLGAHADVYDAIQEHNEQVDNGLGTESLEPVVLTEDVDVTQSQDTFKKNILPPILKEALGFSRRDIDVTYDFTINAKTWSQVTDVINNNVDKLCEKLKKWMPSIPNVQYVEEHGVALYNKGNYKWCLEKPYINFIGKKRTKEIVLSLYDSDSSTAITGGRQVFIIGITVQSKAIKVRFGSEVKYEFKTFKPKSDYEMKIATSFKGLKVSSLVTILFDLIIEKLYFNKSVQNKLEQFVVQPNVADIEVYNKTKQFLDRILPHYKIHNADYIEWIGDEPFDTDKAFISDIVEIWANAVNNGIAISKNSAFELEADDYIRNDYENGFGNRLNEEIYSPYGAVISDLDKAYWSVYMDTYANNFVDEGGRQFLGDIFNGIYSRFNGGKQSWQWDVSSSRKMIETIDEMNALMNKYPQYFRADPVVLPKDVASKYEKYEEYRYIFDDPRAKTTFEDWIDQYEKWLNAEPTITGIECGKRQFDFMMLSPFGVQETVIAQGGSDPINELILQTPLDIVNIEMFCQLPNELTDYQSIVLDLSQEYQQDVFFLYLKNYFLKLKIRDQSDLARYIQETVNVVSDEDDLTESVSIDPFEQGFDELSKFFSSYDLIERFNKTIAQGTTDLPNLPLEITISDNGKLAIVYTKDNPRNRTVATYQVISNADGELISSTEGLIDFINQIHKYSYRNKSMDMLNLGLNFYNLAKRCDQSLKMLDEKLDKDLIANELVDYFANEIKDGMESSVPVIMIEKQINKNLPPMPSCWLLPEERDIPVFAIMKRVKKILERDHGFEVKRDKRLNRYKFVRLKQSSKPSSVMSLMTDMADTSVTQQQPFAEYLVDMIDTDRSKSMTLEEYIYPFFKGKYTPRQAMIVDEIQLTPAQYDAFIEDLWSTPSWLNEKGYTEESFGQTGGYIDGIELTTKEGFPNYYGDLKLKRDATEKEIKKAFRKLAVRMHPDRNDDDPQANQKFVELKNAYEILSDASKKSSYDRLLGRNTVRKGEMIPRMVKIVSDDRMPFYGYTGGYAWLINATFDLADLEALEKPLSKKPTFPIGTTFVPLSETNPPYTRFIYSGWNEKDDTIKYYKLSNFTNYDGFEEQTMYVEQFADAFRVKDLAKQGEYTLDNILFKAVTLASVLDMAFNEYGLNTERYNYVLLNRFFKQFVNGYPFNVKASIKSPKGSMNYFNNWSVKTDGEAEKLNMLFPNDFRPHRSDGFYKSDDLTYGSRDDNPTLVSREYAGDMAMGLQDYLRQKLGSPIYDYTLVPMTGKSYSKSHAEKVVKEILMKRIQFGGLERFGFNYDVNAPMFGTHGVTVTLVKDELDILLCLCVGDEIDFDKVPKDVEPMMPFYALRVKKFDKVIVEKMKNFSNKDTVTGDMLYQCLNMISNELTGYEQAPVVQEPVAEPTPVQQEPVTETKAHWGEKAPKMTLADGTVVFEIPRTDDGGARGSFYGSLSSYENDKEEWYGALGMPHVDPRYETTDVECTEKLSDALKDKRKMPKRVRAGDYALVIDTVDDRVFMIAGTGYQDEDNEKYGQKKAYHIYWQEPYEFDASRTIYEQGKPYPQALRRETKTLKGDRPTHNFVLYEQNRGDGDFYELFDSIEMGHGWFEEPYGADTIGELLKKIPNINSVELYPNGWVSAQNRDNEELGKDKVCYIVDAQFKNAEPTPVQEDTLFPTWMKKEITDGIKVGNTFRNICSGNESLTGIERDMVRRGYKDLMHVVEHFKPTVMKSISHKSTKRYPHGNVAGEIGIFHMVDVYDCLKLEKQVKEKVKSQITSMIETDPTKVAQIFNTPSIYSPSIFTIDFGKSRGQGKRVGGQIKGGMFDLSLQGKKKYENAFGNVPQVSENTIELLLDNPKGIKAYLGARSNGYSDYFGLVFALLVEDVDIPSVQQAEKPVETEPVNMYDVQPLTEWLSFDQAKDIRDFSMLLQLDGDKLKPIVILSSLSRFTVADKKYIPFKFADLKLKGQKLFDMQSSQSIPFSDEQKTSKYLVLAKMSAGGSMNELMEKSASILYNLVQTGDFAFVSNPMNDASLRHIASGSDTSEDDDDMDTDLPIPPPASEENVQSIQFTQFAKLIPYETVRNAYYWSSHDPDGRAKSFLKQFELDMENRKREVIDLGKKYGVSDEVIVGYWNSFKDRYVTKVMDYLTSNANVASTAVTGRGNFNYARNEKKMKSAEKKQQAMIDLYNRGLSKIESKFKKIYVAQSGGELVIAKQFLMKAENDLENAKKVNKIIRSKKLTDQQKIDEILSNDLMTKPKLAEKIVREQLTLSYTSVKNKIQLLKEKIAKLNLKEQQGELSDDERTFEYEDVTIFFNTDADRIQLLFSSFPSDEVRKALKSSAFKWSRKNKAWQRQITDNTVSAINRIFDLEPRLPRFSELRGK